MKEPTAQPGDNNPVHQTLPEKAQAALEALDALKTLQKVLADDALKLREKALLADKNERLTGSVRNMLQNDIDLKKELLVLKEGFAHSFANFARRQVISIALGFCFMLIVLACLIIYFNTPTRLDDRIFKSMQHERKLLVIDRDSLRAVINELIELRK